MNVEKHFFVLNSTDEYAEIVVQHQILLIFAINISALRNKITISVLVLHKIDKTTILMSHDVKNKIKKN